MFWAKLQAYLSERVILTEMATGAANGTVVDLTWLMSALEHTREHDQTRVTGYLEAIADDVIFEMESAANERR